MNFQNLNFDNVEPPPSWVTWTTRFPSVKARKRSKDTASVSSPRSNKSSTASSKRRRRSKSKGNTVPASPPSRTSVSPQPATSYHEVSTSSPTPTIATGSASDLYGPDRYYGQFASTAASQQPHTWPRVQDSSHTQVRQSPAVRFDEGQLAMFSTMGSSGLPSLKDDLTTAAGKVTPGIDDTPYIQYAIEALTKEPDDEGSYGVGYEFPRAMAGQSSSTEPSPVQKDVHAAAPEPETQWPLGSYQTTQKDARYSARYYMADAEEERYENDPLISSSYQPGLGVRALKPAAIKGNALDGFPNPITNLARSTPVLINTTGVDSGHWVPVTREMLMSIDPRGTKYLPLTYRPRILRPLSMLIFSGLTALMMAGLVFCPVFSDDNHGLTPYSGTIYSGTYFVFRILPQILAAVILLYAQSIVSTSMRVLPFVSLSSEQPGQRYLALFRDLYPKTFFWPQINGPWPFKIFSIATCLACFTVPLQSSLFTNIYIHDRWIWAPVKGVAWTLVALYGILLVAGITLMVFWVDRWTGLTWDVRSIGDLIPLLNRSNTLDSYTDVNETAGQESRKGHLRDRWFDRLGYWRTQDMLTGGIWYTIGSPFASSTDTTKPAPSATAQRDGPRSMTSHELAVPTNLTFGLGSFSHLPWFLRIKPLLTVHFVSLALILALLIVSFLPSTKVETGFSPLVPAAPRQPGNFSPADFLYSFLPSLLGVLFFLFFQEVDMGVRVLQPWGELVRFDGGAARKSLLADYAACLPLQCTLHGLRNGHWRVALLSCLSVLFVFVPVLGGGMFIALTSSEGDGNDVLIYPSVPVFALLISLLLVYLLALWALIPQRSQFLMPEGVDMMRLADVISMCSSEELVSDAAFRAVRDEEDLRTRLGAAEDAADWEESLWCLGIGPGRDERAVSIRRMRKFTEKIGPKRVSRTPRDSGAIV